MPHELLGSCAKTACSSKAAAEAEFQNPCQTEVQQLGAVLGLKLTARDGTGAQLCKQPEQEE